MTPPYVFMAWWLIIKHRDNFIFTFYLSMALQVFVGPWPLFFSSLMFYTVGMTPWTGDQPVARSLPAHRTAQTQNKRTRISTPEMEFEPTTPVFERAKTVHALDRAVTLIGTFNFYPRKIPGCDLRLSRRCLWRLLSSNHVNMCVVYANGQKKR
jgi:hypothetical protein